MGAPFVPSFASSTVHFLLSFIFWFLFLSNTDYITMFLKSSQTPLANDVTILGGCSRRRRSSLPSSAVAHLFHPPPSDLPLLLSVQIHTILSFFFSFSFSIATHSTLGISFSFSFQMLVLLLICNVWNESD